MLATQSFFQNNPTLFSAVGGTESTVAGYKYHTYLIGDTGEFFDTSSHLDTTTIEILLVGGGGQAGSGTSGGGGAGGLIYIADFAMPDGRYTITVGAGGAGGAQIADNMGRTGGDSIITDGTRTLTATGGGGGGGQQNISDVYQVATIDSGSGTAGPKSGGSGAAHCGYKSAQGNLNTPRTPTSPFVAAGGDITTGGVTYSNVAFGNNGGVQYASANGGAGGGGGAGGVGQNGVAYDAADGGNGGAGKAIASFNHTVWGGSSNTYYAAGGGGANLAESNTAASGIGGISPAGGSLNAADPGETGGAVINTGSGGGGTWNHGTGIGGDGSSGIVMIRYAV